MNPTILGIDPSSKKCAVCRDGRVQAVASSSLTDHLSEVAEESRAAGKSLLVLWDSPLSFSRAHGYSNRPIDQAASKAIREEEARIEKGAANALHFTGVTHWALTLDVLGIWIDGERQGPSRDDTRIQLVGSRDDLTRAGIHVIETHPTVALCAWWLERSPDRFERYKSLTKATRLTRCRSIWNTVADGPCPNLEIPGLRPDDVLDAWAAWKLGQDWLRGEAELVGSRDEGSYLLPKGRLTESIKALLPA